MKRIEEKPRSKTKVKVKKLFGTDGMFIKKEFLDRREEGKTGEIMGNVSGHGGDVLWVAQDNGIAAYTILELEKIP